MDNLSSHKSAAVRKAIRAAGALLIVLPPYSPDLNPIEQAYSKLKTLLRKENARTLPQTEAGIGKLLGGWCAPCHSGSATPEMSAQIAMRRFCRAGSWACGFGAIRFR